MNKGLIAKIAIGLVVVAIPVFFLFGSKDDLQSVTPDVNIEDTSDILDDLNEDTFEEEQEDSSDEDLDVDESEDFENDTDSKDEEDNMNNNNNNSGNNNSKPENENSQSESKTITAVFQGFADGTFIEMKIGNDYGVFKVSGDVKSKIETRSIGDSVTFTYIESAGQKIITSVD